MWEIKNSKPVKENERIRFRCTRCAACCRHVKPYMAENSCALCLLALLFLADETTSGFYAVPTTFKP